MAIKPIQKPNVFIDPNGEVHVVYPLAMTDKDAAIYLRALGFQTTPKTMSVWRCTGKGPKFKRIGRRVFYEKRWLDEFLKGLEVQVIDPAEQAIKTRKIEARKEA